MSQVPNPGRFVSVTKNQIEKKELFLSAQKIKQIRALPKNSCVQLMESNLHEIANHWLAREIDFSKNENLSRSEFHGFLQASCLRLLTGEETIKYKLNQNINRLLRKIDKTGKNALDLCHSLIVLSLLYHWNKDFLTSKQNHQIEQAVQAQASFMYSKTKTPLGYWGGTPLHNITHCAWCGVGVAGFAFSHILPEAKYWLNDAFHYFNLVSWLQADDGTLIEGGSYSAYETEMRAIFYYLSKELLNENLYRDNHLGIADYFTQLHKPAGSKMNHIFPWGDSSKGIIYHSPNNLLFSLASEFRSVEVQSKAYFILKKGFSKTAGFEWMNLVFYDHRVPYIENYRPLTDFKFPDLGLISSRDSWKENATAISFKCGPYQGFRSRKHFDGDPGGSHCHADSASLQLYGKQTDLLIDPGYEFLKRTNHHNAIMINGYGQLGEGSKWYGVNHALHYDHCGDILYFKAGKKITCWVADARKAYVPEAKLKRYVRSVIFIKPNILLVLDDIETATPSKFEIYWHTPLEKVASYANSVLYQNEKASLSAQFFSNKDAIKITTKNKLFDELMIPANHTYSVVSNTKRLNRFACLSAFVIGEPDEKPAVAISLSKNIIKFKATKVNYKIKIEREGKRLIQFL